MLEENRLEVAAVEVRYNNVGVLSANTALAIQQMALAAGADVSALHETTRQDVEFTISPAGASSSTSVDQGWVLSSHDGTLALTLLPDLVIVQSTAYERFRESLLPALTSVLGSLIELQPPQIVNRVGLRYVNRLTDATASEPSAWRGKLSDELLGLGSGQTFLGKVTATQQQVQLAIETGVGCVLRHGAFLDGTTNAYSYLLDIDVFNSASGSFSLDEILHVATRLNRTAFAVFGSLLAPDYLNAFGRTDLYPDLPKEET